MVLSTSQAPCYLTCYNRQYQNLFVHLGYEILESVTLEDAGNPGKLELLKMERVPQTIEVERPDWVKDIAIGG